MPEKKTPGTKVDIELVERAKAMRQANYKLKDIAKMLDISMATVQRYLARPDDVELAEASGDNELATFVKQYRKKAQNIVMLAAERVELGFKNGEIKAEKAAVIGGIYHDKLMAPIKSHGNPSEKSNQLIQFNFTVSGGEQDGDGKRDTQPDPRQVPPITVEVQGDDNGPRRGKDVQRMLGSGEDEH
jgi:predicted transcriptional regulator